MIRPRSGYLAARPRPDRSRLGGSASASDPAPGCCEARAPPNVGRSFYAAGVGCSGVEDFLRSRAPSDVQDTVAWLTDNGYTLTSSDGLSIVGSRFVYSGEAEVRILVDRGQCYLELAPRPGAKAWQYDLLVAARDDPAHQVLIHPAGAKGWGPPFPEQLPEGVSWRETLPDILRWVQNDTTVASAVDRAERERFIRMWGHPPHNRRRPKG